MPSTVRRSGKVKSGPLLSTNPIVGTQASVINLPGWFPDNWPSYWPSYWSTEWPSSWPLDWFEEWFGILEELPENPCEWVGGSCDALTKNFCHGKHDIKLSLPCSLDGLVGVGCCYHDPTTKEERERKERERKEREGKKID